MEEILLRVLTELGGTAVIGYVFYAVATKMIDSHINEREEHNRNYREYVEANNHQKTALIEKNIESLTKIHSALDDLECKKCK